MSYTKQISFFLCLVLSIQVLPLQQIAAWLSSGQVTEEISHDFNPVKSKSVNDEEHSFFILIHHGDLHFQSANFLANSNYRRDEAIYRRYADDILSPPPNC
jgi:hypothetical protein